MLRAGDVQGVPQFASPAQLAQLRRAMSGSRSQARVRVWLHMLALAPHPEIAASEVPSCRSAPHYLRIVHGTSHCTELFADGGLARSGRRRGCTMAARLGSG